MKTFFRICMALMFCGALSLMAADGETGPTPRDGKGETGETGGRGGQGKHGGRGGRGHVTFMICPNCRHKLMVRSFSGRGHGPGGKGENGEHRGPRRGGKGQRPTDRERKPDNAPQTTEEKAD